MNTRVKVPISSNTQLFHLDPRKTYSTMKSLVISSLCLFSGLSSLVSGASIPRYFEKQPTTRRNLTSQEVRRELGGQVSRGTLIYGPSDAEFANLTSRWTVYSKPDVQVVIEPAAELDVSTIVRFHTYYYL